MAVEAISWVIQQSKAKGNARLVLMIIANHARSDGTGAWPSVATIAKECCITERTVQRCIVSLIKFGELKVRFKQGPYHTNLYELPGVTNCHHARPDGDKTGKAWCQNVHQVVTAVTPNPSLTVLKDKERMELLKLAIQETEKDKSKNKRSAQERFNQYLEEAVARRLAETPELMVPL